MNLVIITLFQKLYPDNKTIPPVLDPSQGHIYTRIIRSAAQHIYTPPRPTSNDYLEHTLPFLAFLPINSSSDASYKNALPSLIRAEGINPDSVLAPYFTALINEADGELNQARDAYERAYQIADSCYPAALGIARVLDANGEQQAATRMLQNMVTIWPDNMTVKRALAANYYKNRDWSRAGPAIAEILQQNASDKEFILMRAHVFVELEQYVQAQTFLGQYARFDANNIFYLFLRARVQFEAYRNRDSALTYLRKALRSPLITDEILTYATMLLMESSRQEEQEEGREMLDRLVRGTTGGDGAADFVEPAISLIELALQDALNRKAWNEAQLYLDRLLLSERTPRYIMSGYQIATGLGDGKAALVWAREIYEIETRRPQESSDYGESAASEASLLLVTAMIGAGETADAWDFIEERLAKLSGGSIKARYYYLRSELRSDDDDELADLRSSIFEDARNLPALVGLFKLYLKRKDETRAFYYLRQALAISPAAPELQSYKQEYASRL
jgi:Tfp pilus assembly protein PilF